MSARLPQEVESLLRWWLPRVLEVIGSRTRSMVLGGSVALQDFSPPSSDVDLYALLNSPLLDDKAALIGSIHEEAKERFIARREGAWKSDSLVEACYLPASLATDTEGNWRYFSVRTNSAMWVKRNLSPFSRYIVARWGVQYYGEPACFTLPGPASLIAQISSRKSKWLSPPEDRLSRPGWMAKQVELMARSIVFLREGLVLSSSAALRREINTRSRFAEAYRTALSLREKGSLWGRRHMAEISAAFHAIRQEAAHVVATLIEKKKHCPPK